MNEDEWGDLECLYKDYRTALTVGGLFTDTGVDDEVMMNSNGESDNEMRHVRT